MAAVNKQARGQGLTSEFPRLLGGRTCLDFANTVESPRADPEEHLYGYADLVAWSYHAGVVDEAAVTRLRALAADVPEDAQAVFDRAIALRGSVDRVFRRVAAGEEPPREDLERIESEHVAALQASSLARSGARFEWTWSGADDLGSPLWPVAASAVELLTEGDLARVRQCPGADDCGWLFYDASRNGTRRWCSMEGCGSRVKMRRSYAKRRARGL